MTDENKARKYIETAPRLEELNQDALEELLARTYIAGLNAGVKQQIRHRTYVKSCNGKKPKRKSYILCNDTETLFFKSMADIARHFGMTYQQVYGAINLNLERTTIKGYEVDYAI